MTVERGGGKVEERAAWWAGTVVELEDRRAGA